MKTLIFMAKAVFGMVVAAFVLLFVGAGSGLIAYAALLLKTALGG